MAIPIFLSRATPEGGDRGKMQTAFLDRLSEYLRDRGLEPSTVGKTHYAANGIDEIRGLIQRSSGLITVAFKRELAVKLEADARNHPRMADYLFLPEERDGSRVRNIITTPWCHMEAAMAFQVGLPILILIESGVRADGALEKGVLGEYPPSFTLDSEKSVIDESFVGDEAEKWRQLVRTWEGNVREVVRTRSRPQTLYAYPSW